MTTTNVYGNCTMGNFIDRGENLLSDYYSQQYNPITSEKFVRYYQGLQQCDGDVGEPMETLINGPMCLNTTKTVVVRRKNTDKKAEGNLNRDGHEDREPDQQLELLGDDVKIGTFKAVSYNGSGLKSTKRLLLSTDATIACLQEHGIVRDEVAGFQTWALRNGWQALIIPAVPAEGMGYHTSCGTAVCVKLPHGLRQDEKRRLPAPFEHRAIRCLVDVIGWKSPIGISSAYFQTGAEHREANSEMCRQLMSLTSFC